MVDGPMGSSKNSNGRSNVLLGGILLFSFKVSMGSDSLCSVALGLQSETMDEPTEVSLEKSVFVSRTDPPSTLLDLFNTGIFFNLFLTLSKIVSIFLLSFLLSST